MAGAVIVIGAVIFAGGIVVGFIAMVSLGIKREEWDFRRTGRVSLTRPAPALISGGARSVLGVHVRERDPEAAPPLRRDLLV